MSGLLIVRPEPGAAKSAAHAEMLGLDPVVAPIFTVQPLDWQAPDPASVDALMLTSANAVRHGGPGVAGLLHLPCYAVGEGTAAEARSCGFSEVRVGSGDGAALAALVAAEGIGRALHLCGSDHKAVEAPGLAITRRIVYAAEPIVPLPTAAGEALAQGALVLIHSSRSGRHFAALVDEAGFARDRIRLAAISEAAAGAAGEGWGEKAIAKAPRDEALLELAAKLCETRPR